MAHGYRYLIFALLLALLPTARCHAIEPNPTLAAQILLTKNKFQKALRNEEIAQGLMGEGHIAIGHEVHATNNQPDYQAGGTGLIHRLVSSVQCHCGSPAS